MQLLSRHWPRIAVTLVPLVFALLHASGVLPIGVLQRLDDIIYDARLRATMPKTIDDRIVIVDIDEKSLAEIGRWPWGRNKLADLMEELVSRQQVALVGFDLVFAEPDDSSGLKRLQQLAQNELKDQPGFAQKLGQIQSGLDYDAVFAKSLEKQPVVMGYYLTSDRDGRVNGVLPQPVMHNPLMQGRPIKFTSCNLNEEHRAKGIPEIAIGMGLNTGSMCVGDMGSDIRRSYTVMGDSVNLGSRSWAFVLKAYRMQDWDHCVVELLNLQRLNAKKYLYQLYTQRVASMRLLPFDPIWDSATHFQTK